jgi:prevent-host-death family protein
MNISSTEFRKHFGQMMERALTGETIEITHEGRVIKLVLADEPSTLSRLVPHDTIVGTLDDLERAQAELDKEMRESFERRTIKE